MNMSVVLAFTAVDKAETKQPEATSIQPMGNFLDYSFHREWF